MPPGMQYKIRRQTILKWPFFSFKMFLPSFCIFFLLISSTFASSPVSQPCIANCSALLKHSLGSILRGGANRPSNLPPFSPSIVHSPQLLAPLHSVIQSSTNNIVVRRKTEWICLSVDKFKLCSDACDDNRQKMVQLANLGHWTTICRLLFESPKIFSDFISCQRKHLEEVANRCHQQPKKEEKSDGHQKQQPQNGRQQISLKLFCKNIRDYTKCYAGTRMKCSRNATQVYRQITDSIGHSFARIRQLSRGHLRIPDDCRTPIADTVQAIVEKGSREAEETILDEENSNLADYWSENGDKQPNLAGGNVRRKASNGWSKNERGGTKLMTMICFFASLFLHIFCLHHF